MAQQNSEDRVVPDGGVTPAQPGGASTGGQGKAIPVDQAASQLRLPIATAEAPQGGSRDRFPDHSGGRADGGAPKAIVNEQTCVPATMDEVVERLDSALSKVVSNKGAPGPDGMTVEALSAQWPSISPKLRADLLAGRWRPGEIRRAHIPKVGGGKRGLGIPNVADRVVMEAVRAVLEPRFEPTFHPSSHGFRPGRSCHTAVAEAAQHMREGHEWVVDVDLEKFFDRVNHQRLMARLARRVGDRRLLVLIGRLLRAKVVLPDGVVIGVDEGVPQGSPLSPLLSNVVLDELDQELARRGHRFVRYADDCAPRTQRRLEVERTNQMRCCTRDGGVGRLCRRTSAAALQEEAANHPELLRSRAVVVSVVGKGAPRVRQVWITKANASKPLMKCRKRIGDIKTGVESFPRDEPGGCLPTGQVVSGMKVARAWSGLSCGTWEPVAPHPLATSGAALAHGPRRKGEPQAAGTARGRVPTRGTGADHLVVAAMPGNAGGAKGMGRPGLLSGQPQIAGGAW